jgi:elongation factor 2
MSKSANKHNRIYAKAAPLEDGLADAIEKGTVNPKDDPKERVKILAETFGWDRTEAGSKLWSFGPENTGPNLVVD